MEMIHFSFKKKVISVVLLTLIILTCISFLSFKRLNFVADKSELFSKPDLDLLFLQQFKAELFESDNAVRSYLLTREEDYLIPFYESVKFIDDRMIIFERINKDVSKHNFLTNKLGSLLVEKFENLNELLKLNQNDVIAKKLNILSEELTFIQGKKDLVKYTAVKKNKKKFVLPKKSIKSSTTEIEQQTSASTAINKEARIIENKISRVKEDQQEVIAESKESEIALLRKDQLFMLEIFKLIDRMKQLENHSLDKKIKENEIITSEYKSIIINFCIIVTSLFLIANLLINKTLKNFISESNKNEK